MPDLLARIGRVLAFLGDNSVASPQEYVIDCSLTSAPTLNAAASLKARMTQSARRIPLVLGAEFQTSEILIDDKNAATERDGDVIWITAGREYGTNEEVEINLQYSGPIPEEFAFRNEDGLWLELKWESLWYPTVAVCGPDEEFTYSLRCEAPEGIVAMANADLARSSDGDSKSALLWTSNRESSTFDVVLLAGPYILSERVSGDLCLDCYAFPAFERKIQNIADTAFRLLAYYSDRFSRLDRRLTIVTPPSSPSGNWARSGLIVGGQVAAAPEPLRIFGILAHELSHQWWGDRVRFDFVKEPWLPEGLATFSTLSALLHIHGEKAARDELANRVLPRCQVAQRAGIALADCRLDSPHSNALREDTAGIFLALLRNRVGADNFDRKVGRLVLEHERRLLSARSFVSVMLEEAPEQMHNFVHQWLNEPTRPEAQIEQILAGLR